MTVCESLSQSCYYLRTSFSGLSLRSRVRGGSTHRMSKEGKDVFTLLPGEGRSEGPEEFRTKFD